MLVPFSAGAHSGQLGPFVILGFPEPGEPEVVTVETVGGNLYVDKPEEVRLAAPSTHSSSSAA